jgi:hypothetical protein
VRTGIDFAEGRRLWRIHHHSDTWKLAECFDDQRADVAPLEAAVAAAERRDRYGVDVPFLDDLTQAGQASLDVAQL